MELSSKDKAEDLFVKHLELIPDYIIKDNKEAAGFAKTHTFLTIDLMLEELNLIKNKNEDIKTHFAIMEEIYYLKEVQHYILKMKK